MFDVLCCHATDSTPCATNLFQSAMYDIWESRKELQSQDADTWVSNFSKYINQPDRFEITLYHSGELVGVAVAVLEVDPHVGPAVVVKVCYVYPEWRESRAYRWLHRALRDIGRFNKVPYICSTKYKGNSTYEVKYIPIRK